MAWQGYHGVDVNFTKYGIEHDTATMTGLKYPNISFECMNYSLQSEETWVLFGWLEIRHF